MGFLDRLFGKRQAPRQRGRSGGTSLAGTLLQQGSELEPASCGKCGRTTLSCRARVWVFSVGEPQVTLDVGGYCPRCHKTLCPSHLSFALVRPTHMPVPDELIKTSWGVVCETCGTQVQFDSGGSPGGDVTIVTLDAKDLEPRQPTRNKALTAPSGKFSLLKVLQGALREAGADADFPQLVCEQCFQLHPHPIPARPLGVDGFRKAGISVSPADFEVDVGGDCPTCGAICGRHAELRLVRIQGTEALALHCAVHGVLLT